MTDATHSFETSVLTRATRHHIPQDVILHSHRRENLKSYRPLTEHQSFVLEMSIHNVCYNNNNNIIIIIIKSMVTLD
jgi:hypothetical protein